MLHHTHRSTIVGRLRATTEGDMVVVDEACALDALVEVGVGSFVDVRQAKGRVGLSELVGIEHLQTLVD